MESSCVHFTFVSSHFHKPFVQAAIFGVRTFQAGDVYFVGKSCDFLFDGSRAIGLRSSKETGWLVLLFWAGLLVFPCKLWRVLDPPPPRTDLVCFGDLCGLLLFSCDAGEVSVPLFGLSALFYRWGVGQVFNRFVLCFSVVLLFEGEFVPLCPLFVSWGKTSV